MTQPYATVICPHCLEAVEPAAFCGRCGLALPGVPLAPRLVTAKTVAVTAAGQKLQTDALLTTATQAARSLLTVGIVNVALAGVIAYQIVPIWQQLQQRRPVYLHYEMISTGTMAATGLVFIALYYWAKFAPLAAAVVALTVYLLRWAMDLGLLYLYRAELADGNSYASVGIVRLFMVVYLIRGVMAGVRHRKLLGQQPESAFAVLPIENP